MHSYSKGGAMRIDKASGNGLNCLLIASCEIYLAEKFLRIFIALKQTLLNKKIKLALQLRTMEN